MRRRCHAAMLSLALLLALPAAAEPRFEGGDGSSLAGAIRILGAAGESDGVDAEYAWVAAERPGWQVERQALVQDGQRVYDVLSLRKGAQTQDVFFDITDFFGKF